MLGSAIGSHPQVAMHGEVFGAHHFPLNFYGIDENLPWPTPIETALKRIRDADPERFLGEFVFSRTARACVGFKFKFEEFALWPTVVDYIANSNIDIIKVDRRDRGKRLLSELRIANSGRFNTSDKTVFGGYVTRFGPPSEEMVDADSSKSEDYENSFSLRFHENSVMQVAYEEMLEDWETVSRNVCSFLKIVEAPLVPTTVKISRLTDDDAAGSQ